MKSSDRSARPMRNNNVRVIRLSGVHVAASRRASSAASSIVLWFGGGSARGGSIVADHCIVHPVRTCSRGRHCPRWVVAIFQAVWPRRGAYRNCSMWSAKGRTTERRHRPPGRGHRGPRSHLHGTMASVPPLTRLVHGVSGRHGRVVGRTGRESTHFGVAHRFLHGGARHDILRRARYQRHSALRVPLLIAYVPQETFLFTIRRGEHRIRPEDADSKAYGRSRPRRHRRRDTRVSGRLPDGTGRAGHHRIGGHVSASPSPAAFISLRRYCFSTQPFECGHHHRDGDSQECGHVSSRTNRGHSLPASRRDRNDSLILYMKDGRIVERVAHMKKS